MILLEHNIGTVVYAGAGVSLMDGGGHLRLNSLADTTSDGGVIAFISSPGTPSILSKESSDLLSYESGPPATLICRGATLASSSSTSAAEQQQDRISLATSSLVAGTIVLDGIAIGDIEAGLRDSRHGLTLSAIFRAKLCQSTTTSSSTPQEDGDDDDTAFFASSKQTLVLPVRAEQLPLTEEKVANEVASLFTAVALESGSGTRSSFAELYDLRIVPFTDPEQVRQSHFAYIQCYVFPFSHTLKTSGMLPQKKTLSDDPT